MTEPGSVHRHRAHAPKHVACAVVTVSDTRSLADDTGGALLCELLEAAGHTVAERTLVRDDAAEIGAALDALLARADCAAVLLTGGTGVAPRDVTPEAVTPRLDRTLPGFGELFRQLSFAEIGAAAMVSRALAGIASGKPVFALPGSRGAIRLALEQLILPELGHLVGEAQKTG
ncbi:MAG: molybdenum cofactor biosynthesis protein B [Myxococcota bacterium]